MIKCIYSGVEIHSAFRVGLALIYFVAHVNDTTWIIIFFRVKGVAAQRFYIHDDYNT